MSAVSGKEVKPAAPKWPTVERGAPARIARHSDGIVPQAAVENNAIPSIAQKLQTVSLADAPSALLRNGGGLRQTRLGEINAIHRDSVKAMCMDAEKVKAWRIRSAVPQYEISRRTGISRSRLSYWESGHVVLKADELPLVAAAIQDAAACQIAELLTLKSEIEAYINEANESCKQKQQK